MAIDPDDAQIPDDQDGNLSGDEEDVEGEKEDSDRVGGSSGQPIGRRNGFHRPIV